MGRGKGYRVKRQDHEHEKPKTAKRFSEAGEQTKTYPEGTAAKE
ncbi:hypothetical protein [Thalassobacillus pellis]|nr:hypothetical protein [Thalassobacillus pellis]MBM7552506.1 hypothetical protein [Thalassobacillus pellis]